MSKTVNTLAYWMPILRQIREFQEIAKTEDAELNILYAEIERVLNNMYIETSDEYGISRLEKIMKINPDAGDTLENRRFRVLSRWNDRVPYTDRELYNRLLNLCGEGNFEILENYKDYELNIITMVSLIGSFDEICRMMDLMIPCNIVMTIENILNSEGVGYPRYGIAVATSMRYTITNDINEKYSNAGIVYMAGALSSASSRVVTNDIDVTDSIEGTSYFGNAVGSANTVLSTNDLNTNSVAQGTESIATPLSTTTVISIQ
jgi:hypothetical protein